MDFSLTRSDSVYSKDGQMLGSPQFIAHRLEDDENNNPELRYYPAHVRIVSRSLGTNFHVPTEFFASRDSAEGKVTLSITKHEVLNYWMRLPKFVARGNYHREDLAQS
jgi:hypothetical protein